MLFTALHSRVGYCSARHACCAVLCCAVFTHTTVWALSSLVLPSLWPHNSTLPTQYQITPLPPIPPSPPFPFPLLSIHYLLFSYLTFSSLLFSVDIPSSALSHRTAAGNATLRYNATHTARTASFYCTVLYCTGQYSTYCTP